MLGCRDHVRLVGVDAIVVQYTYTVIDCNTGVKLAHSPETPCHGLTNVCLPSEDNLRVART